MRYLRIGILLLLPLAAQAQWTQTTATSKTGYECLLVSGQYLFAGSWGEGVFRSSDNGNNWIPVNNGLTDTLIRTIFAYNGFLFVGTADSGVFRSSDSGSTWKSINTGLTNLSVRTFASNGSDLFMGVDAELVYSTNDGDSWWGCGAGLWGETPSCIAVRDTELFVGTYSSGVFRSTDNGAIWSYLTGPIYFGAYSLEIAGPNIIAGTARGAYISTNDGKSWRLLSMANSTSIHNEFATKRNTLFCEQGTGSVFLSNDSGITWSMDSYLFNHVGQSNCIVVNNAYVFIGTAFKGIWRRSLVDFGLRVTPNFKSTTSISVFPNPALRGINVAFSHADGCSYSLNDMFGREVLHGSLGRSPASIDVSIIPSGSYYLHITTAEGYAINHVVIEH